MKQIQQPGNAKLGKMKRLSFLKFLLAWILLQPAKATLTTLTIHLPEHS
jgi:hypothetical protein